MSYHNLYPHDRKPGCLPRKSQFGKLFAPASEKIKVIPKADWGKYTGKISLKPFVKTILDQDGVGSCACEAVTQAVMIARAIAGLPHVELNPWFIYHTTSGGWDRGSSIDENLAFVLENGIAPMDVWSRDEGWRKEPSAAAKEAALEFRNIEVFDIASIEDMVSALFDACAVPHGAKGHAVCKVEHLSDKEGDDVNSWGTGWKNNGFGVWVPYRSINFNYGAFAVRIAR